MKIAFFTEAGSKRGMGHLIRCKAIADEFYRNNVYFDFFLDSDINYDYKFQNFIYFRWENLKIDNFYDVILLDSYEADSSIYELITHKSKIAVYIDDYERITYPKGVIINFAPDAKKLFFKNKKKENNYLLGMDYLPIRKEFFKYKYQKKEEKIFIMLGGSDTANLSKSIIEALKDIKIKKVLVSINEQMKKELINNKNVEVLLRPTDEELIIEMSSSSYAISTVSMSLYELSFLEIPTIVVAVSKNQIDGVSQIMKNKLASAYIDVNKKDFLESIKDKTIELMANQESLERKIDGLGTKRIYEYIMKGIEK